MRAISARNIHERSLVYVIIAAYTPLGRMTSHNGDPGTSFRETIIFSLIALITHTWYVHVSYITSTYE